MMCLNSLLAISVTGIAVVCILYSQLMSDISAHKKASKIADAISSGAMTFLYEEYKIIISVVGIVALGICYLMSQSAALMFIVGALFSMITGFIGMRAATAANVRTAIAAKNKGEHAAFMIAFFGGGVMGFAVASFGLLGLSGIMYYYAHHMQIVDFLTCFSLGASLVAFFARIGGGIYTKSADVGADLVGKVEAGIPEDDPRNPAVIADNVGDCVGDTAGMGADIYESYVGAMVSSMILAISSFPENFLLIKLPLVLAGIGLLSSIIGLASNFIFKTKPDEMLRNATYIAIALFLGGSYYYLKLINAPIELILLYNFRVRFWYCNWTHY